MGPGGILWRKNDEDNWTSLESASSWGAEKLLWPKNWSIGFDRDNSTEASFLGSELNVSYYYRNLKFENKSF